MDKTPRTDKTDTPPAKPSAPHAAPARRPMRWETIGVVAAAVLVITALASPRRSDTDVVIDNMSRQPQSAAASISPHASPAPIAASVTQSAAAPRRAVNVRAKRTPAPEIENDRIAKPSQLAARPIVSMTPAVKAAPKDDAASMPIAAESRAAAAAPAALSAEILGRAAVTITGCLEMSLAQDEFRLTDTEGVNAPRARDWRTVFLTTRPAPVALVEPSDPRGLQRQVGKRVAATGMLTSRELKLSSLHVVGACN